MDFKFLLRKIKAFKWFGLRHVLLLFIISPALDKTRSDGALVAGTQRYLLTNLCMFWKRLAFSLHHVYMLTSGSSFASAKYLSTSLLTGSTWAASSSNYSLTKFHMSIFGLFPTGPAETISIEGSFLIVVVVLEYAACTASTNLVVAERLLMLSMKHLSFTPCFICFSNSLQ